MNSTESERARQRGAELDRVEPLAKAAHFLIDTNTLVVMLKNGSGFTVPRRLLPKPFSSRSADLEAITIDPPGTGIWFDALDEGLQVTTLLEIVVGTDWLRQRGAGLAGSVKSEKKAEAARRNGASGGRPRKRELVPA